MPQPKQSPQMFIKPALIVFSIAIIVRMIFLYLFTDTLLYTNHVVDMAFHSAWATAIANGESFYNGPFFRAPLYPLLLGMIYKLISTGPLAIRIIQLFLGSVSCVVLFFIGTRLFSRKVGFIAGLIMALYGPMIYFEAQLLSVSFTLFFYLLGLYFLIDATDGDNKRAFISSGLFFGLGAITRPNILLFLLVLVIWIMFQIFRKQTKLTGKAILPFLIGIIIPILPITISNYAKSGELILIGSYGGINAYLGNYSGADGVSAVIPGVRQDWWGGFEDTHRIAQQETGKMMTDKEVSSFWLQKTFREIFDNPGHFLKLTGKKLILLIEGNELSNNFDFYYFARQPWITKLLIWHKLIYFPWGLILPLAIAGLFFFKPYTPGKKFILIYLITMSCSILFFLVAARYRMILVPPVILFTAVGIDGFFTKFRNYSVVKRAVILKVVIILLVLANTDIWGFADNSHAHGYHTTATIYSRHGNKQLAKQYYLKALEADPNQSETLNDLGLLYDAEDSLAKAIPLIRKAAELPNATFIIKYNLAYLYLRNQQPGKAVPVLKQVITEAPDYLYGYNNLGLAYLQLGFVDSSMAVYKELLKFDPYFPSAMYNLGYGFLALNQADSARYYFENYIKMLTPQSPDYPEVRHILDSLSN